MREYRIAGMPLMSNNGAFNREVSSVADLSNPMDMRVYWEDTDGGGVVYYANYLRFFERARTEWLRGLGMQQSSLQAQSDCIFVVAEVQLRYLVAARLDDLITVTVKPIEWGKASLQLEQQVWRDQTLLAEARVRIGCVSATTFKPRRIPERLRTPR